MDTLPNNDTIRATLILIYGNAGKMILSNMLCTHGTISADPDCMDTKYRLLRAHVYSGLFWLGSWSRESTICTLTNWDEPMKVSARESTSERASDRTNETTKGRKNEKTKERTTQNHF